MWEDCLEGNLDERWSFEQLTFYCLLHRRTILTWSSCKEASRKKEKIVELQMLISYFHLLMMRRQGKSSVAEPSWNVLIQYTMVYTFDCRIQVVTIQGSQIWIFVSIFVQEIFAFKAEGNPRLKDCWCTSCHGGSVVQKLRCGSQESASYRAKTPSAGGGCH